MLIENNKDLSLFVYLVRHIAKLKWSFINYIYFEGTSEVHKIFNPLTPGVIITCSWKAQVCLSMYNLLVDTRLKGVKDG